MVDDVGHRHGIEQAVVVGKVLGVEVQHDVPVELGDTVDQRPEFVEVWCATKVGHEVEAGPAHLVLVEMGKIVVCVGTIDHGDAGVPTIAVPDRVDHGCVVGAMTAGLHEDCSLQTQPCLERLEVVDA